MAMDITEHDKEFEILANLPGFKKEDVKLSIHDNQLMVEANCNLKNEEKRELYIVAREIAVHIGATTLT
jgi:HSP20 family protein